MHPGDARCSFPTTTCTCWPPAAAPWDEDPEAVDYLRAVAPTHYGADPSGYVAPEARGIFYGPADRDDGHRFPGTARGERGRPSERRRRAEPRKHAAIADQRIRVAAMPVYYDPYDIGIVVRQIRPTPLRDEAPLYHNERWVLTSGRCRGTPRRGAPGGLADVPRAPAATSLELVQSGSDA